MMTQNPALVAGFSVFIGQVNIKANYLVKVTPTLLGGYSYYGSKKHKPNQYN